MISYNNRWFLFACPDIKKGPSKFICLLFLNSSLKLNCCFKTFDLILWLVL